MSFMMAPTPLSISLGGVLGASDWVGGENGEGIETTILITLTTDEQEEAGERVF
jgi:hypothetical protein